MKNQAQSRPGAIKQVLKFFANAFKSIFQSESNSDFVRLKNFIAQ